MKKNVFLILLLLVGTIRAQVQKTQNLLITTSGSTTPNSSAILDINSTTKGFLPPRMTSSQMNAIATPATGLLVYCTDCNPISLYAYNGSAWNPSFRSNSEGLTANCALNGFNPDYNYIQYTGTDTTNSYLTITVTNNSISSTTTYSFASTNIVLSGVSGLTVGTPIPATATIPIGSSQLVKYPISGTPTSTGTLTASFKKDFAICTTTTSVSSFSSNVAITNSISNNFILNQPYTGTIQFVLYSKPLEIKNCIAPTISDLTISGSGKGSLTVASVTPSTTLNLSFANPTNIVFTLSGTPVAGSINFTFNYSGLNYNISYAVGY